MTNQQSNQQSSGSQSSTEIALANRVYSFRTLPQEIQEKLLRLQNTEGNFLRLSDGGTVLWAVLLVLALPAFMFSAFMIVASGINAESAVVLAVGSAIFLIWIAYFGWRLFKPASSPVGNNIYLTPTQLIQTKDGYVRYRELKDVSEIEFRTIRGNGGNSHVLICKLHDNDSFKFIFSLGMFAARTAEANSWKDKAVMWRNSAINAFQNGDAAYFNLFNTFQGLSEANTPAVKRKSGCLPVMILLLITFSLPMVGMTAYGVVSPIWKEAELWNTAVSKNTVTSYLSYTRGKGGKHTAEAAQKINGFYDETTKKIKENQANASDPKGVEAVLNLLENAKVKQDNEVSLRLAGTPYNKEDEVRQKISLQFKKMFPDETLSIKKKYQESKSVNPLESSMEVKISTPTEQPKTPNKKAKGTSNLAPANASETKYDFNCVISVPDKPKYGFEIKSATVEDFNNELAKRFGLAAP